MSSRYLLTTHMHAYAPPGTSHRSEKLVGSVELLTAITIHFMTKQNKLIHDSTSNLPGPAS